MRELNVNEVEEISGGFVALYWVVKGGIYAYRTYSTVRTFSGAFAAAGTIAYAEEALSQP